jgi:hypothetical protein
MPHARPRSVGLDVHQDAIAVASGATDQDAAVSSLGTMGTRPGDIDQLGRQLPAKATPRVCS